jgi:hypothetical protein
MTNEVFTESVERFAVPDVAAIMALGVNIYDRCDTWHILSRLKFNAGAMAIESQLLATFHARISGVTVNPDSGERVFTIIGLGRDGDRFSFDISERNYWQRRQFLNALANHAGAGTFIVPGRVAATQRAVWDLSGAEE